MNKLTEMQAFTSVIDQGGFTGAARHLGISKSAVSKHVTALESRLGVSLLTRTTRRVDPTEVGLLYYDRAHKVLTAAEDADQVVSEVTGAATGSLRVAVMDETSMRLAAPHVPGFLDAHPDVLLSFETVTGHVEPLLAGYDAFLRSGTQPESKFHSQLMTNVQYVLVASPTYMKAHGGIQRIEDLASRDLLQRLATDGTRTLDLRNQSGENRRIFTPGRLVARETELLVDAAVKGLGIAFLPRFMVEPHISAGRLEQILGALPQQSVPVHVACAPSQTVTPKVRAFFDYFLDACNGAGGAVNRPK